MTLEAIAEADGTVSTKTVQRSLDSTLSFDKVPAKTVGKDKKKRPTKYKPSLSILIKSPEKTAKPHDPGGYC